MDVTTALGAARADSPRGSTARARAGQSDFDAFFRPAVADDPIAEPSARMDEASRIERQAAERDARERTEARRAEDRRADERAAERRAERRAAERRAEERSAADRERRADEAADRRADDARRQGADDAAGQKDRAKSTSRVDEADRRTEPDDESPAGALGLTGLLERLTRESKAVEFVEFGGAGGEEIGAHDFDALDLDAVDAMLDEGALEDAALDDADGLELDPTDLAGELGDDLTQLFDKGTDALTRALGGRRGPLDTVRIGGRPVGEGTAFGGPLLLSTPARAPEAAVVQAPRGALPRGVDESSVLRQISDALRLGDAKNRSAEIALHPAELGRIKVRIAMEAGAARIIVGAEHAAVADLLSQNLDQLRRDLMAQGVQVSHLEVQSDDAGQHGERRERPEDEDAEVIERPEPRPAAPRTRAAARPRGRIDLKA